MVGLSLGLAVADAAPALPIGMTAAFAIAVAIAGMLTRRRMPAGVGEGTFIAAVSGAAILLLVFDSAANVSRPALGHVLTALTVLWYAASRLAARAAVRTASRASNSENNQDATLVWAYAALVCGLAALANLVSTAGGFAAGTWSAGATDFVVLLALAALIRVFWTGAWAPYTTIAVLSCLLVMLAPADSLDTSAPSWGIGLNVVAVACLGLVIGVVLQDWRRQRRQWLEQSEPATQSPPEVLLAILVVVCVVVGLVGVMFRGYWLTPTALWLAGLACLVIGHACVWLVAGEIGLALVGAGIVSASMAWLTPGWPGAVFGLGLAGGYLLWLARFWDQQLLDGVAWTTAGGLIPAARRLGYVASSGAVMATVGGLLAGAFDGQSLWMPALTVVLLLGGMSLLVRDGMEQGRAEAMATACLLAMAAVGPGCALVVRLAGVPLVPAVGVAGAVLLVAIRGALAMGGSRGSTSGAEPGRYESSGAEPGRYGAVVYGAVVGGVLPVVMLFGLSWTGFTVQTVIGVVLTLAAVTVGAMVLCGGARGEEGNAGE